VNIVAGIAKRDFDWSCCGDAPGRGKGQGKKGRIGNGLHTGFARVLNHGTKFRAMGCEMDWPSEPANMSKKSFWSWYPGDKAKSATLGV
jgi:hypothetical protein